MSAGIDWLPRVCVTCMGICLNPKLKTAKKSNQLKMSTTDETSCGLVTPFSWLAFIRNPFPIGYCSDALQPWTVSGGSSNFRGAAFCLFQQFAMQYRSCRTVSRTSTARILSRLAQLEELEFLNCSINCFKSCSLDPLERSADQVCYSQSEKCWRR